MEETLAYIQEIPEEPGTAGSDMDEANRIPNLHGLTGTMEEAALDTN